MSLIRIASSPKPRISQGNSHKFDFHCHLEVEERSHGYLEGINEDVDRNMKGIGGIIGESHLIHTTRVIALSNDQNINQ